MNYGPIARIVLRYGIGFFAGSSLGEQLSLDPDIVGLVALGMGAAVEAVYLWAKKRGWAT